MERKPNRLMTKDEICEKRRVFIEGYCAAKGWDPEHLTSEQKTELIKSHQWPKDK